MGGTDPKQLGAVIEGTQGICRVVLVDPMNRELVPRQFFGCAGLANYLSPRSPLDDRGMGMDVRVRIDEANDSPTEVEDCRNRVNLGPIELLDSPHRSNAGAADAAHVQPSRMMLDTCTPSAWPARTTVRETRGRWWTPAPWRGTGKAPPTPWGSHRRPFWGAAAILVIIASQTTNPFAAAVLGVIAIILAVIGLPCGSLGPSPPGRGGRALEPAVGRPDQVAELDGGRPHTVCCPGAWAIS